jgi:protein-tyrosine phosphatase
MRSDMSRNSPPLTQQDHQARHLPWDACYNARELGGYPTESGSATRWKALIRSDSLYHLTPAGQAALRDYGVRTIIDLRSPHELETHANPFAAQQEIEDAPRYLHIHLVDDVTAALGDATGSMIDDYCIILDRRKESMASVINAVASTLQDGAVLVHCAGGKDRTGIIIALLLSLAGVPRETIIEDYALSEILLEPPHSEWLAKQSEITGEPVERPIWMHSRPETMQAVFDYLDREYGGVEPYLHSAGVTPATMTQIRTYLTNPPGGGVP